MQKMLCILGLMMFLTGCSVVGPGERGFSVSMGSVGTIVREPGVYFWFPFIYGSKTINVQIQKSDVRTGAASKDMQEITTEVAVNWSINPDSVMTMYKTIGDESDVYERIIQPAVSEVMKAASAMRTAREILTNRMDLKKDIDEGLRARLATYGVNLTDVSIVNLTFSQEFTDAIEKTQVAEQQAKQAQYDAQRAIEEAKAMVNKAKGEAEANSLKQKTLTPQLIQYEAIQRWNGVLPSVSTGNAVPFINVTPKN